MWYMEVTEEPLAISDTCTAEAFQQLPLNDEAPPSARQGSSTHPVSVQILHDILCFVRIDLARFFKCVTVKGCPKTACTTFDFSEQFFYETVEKEILIFVGDFLKAGPFQLKPQRSVFSQPSVRRSFRRFFFCLLKYRSYLLVNANLKTRHPRSHVLVDTSKG